MNTTPVTISFPTEIHNELKKATHPRLRSKFVSEAVKSKLNEIKLAKNINPWSDLVRFTKDHPTSKQSFSDWLNHRHDEI